MGLLTKPAALTAISRAIYTWLNARVDDLYNIIGTTANGRGSLNYLNLSATADLAPGQGRGTFATLTDPDALGQQLVTRATRFAAEKLTLLMGSGTAEPKVGGLISAQTTYVGNVGVGEDDLMTYSLPANALTTTARGIRIKCWGVGANNANAKRLRLYFGSAAILDVTITTGSARSWEIVADVIRTGSNTQKTYARIIEGANSGAAVAAINGAQLHAAPTQTETSAIVIKMTGEATANDDVIQEGMVIEFI